jgi:phage-related protein
MIQVFEWSPAPEATGAIAFAVRTAKFGDGYQQDVADGINTKSDSWPLTFVGGKAKADAISAFLDWHAGWRSFQWTPPLGKPGLYKCLGYNVVPHGAQAFTITATFAQAPGVLPA